MEQSIVLSVAVISTLAALGTASGSIWHIHPDSTVNSVQAGIDSSSNGDTVLVHPATYVENINFNGKNIALGSLFLATGDTSYISSTIIDGDSSGSVVTFENGENSTALVTGFTIQNGQAEKGGGVRCSSSSPSVIDVIISGNTAYGGLIAMGGGIYCDSSSPNLTNVTVSANTAYAYESWSYGYGGGVYCEHSTPSLTNIAVSGNTADVGGGICCRYSSSPNLTNCTIERNSGGGIHCWNNSNTSLTNVTINGNRGGGIRCYDNSSPSLTDVAIDGNTARYVGGGVYCTDNSSPSLENVSIEGNTADWGAGIYCSYSSPSLTNVIINGNTTRYVAAGAVHCYDSSPSLTTVIIDGNDARGIYCSYSSPSLTNVTIHGNGYGGIFCDNSNPSLVNCILWNDGLQEVYLDGTSSLSTIYSDIEGGWPGIGNIDSDPLVVGSGEHPFSLQEGSPCVDAGTPDTAGLNLPPWDMIGNVRIWDGDGNGSAIIDMGAYEYGAPAVGIDHKVVVEPTTHILLGNYPNPFSSHTAIRYGLREDSKVSLKVYGLLGQEIRELVDEFQQSGMYLLVWDGSDNSGRRLPSGPYFLRLQVGEHTSTKKLSVLR